MKKWGLTLVAVALLSACSSSPEKRQSANDTYQRTNGETGGFASLASGGVNLPKQDTTYELPKIANKTNGEKVDIRPPSVPLAIINNSLTQFDGERALIVYSENQAELYNLTQVERVLKEEGITSKINGAILTTDWASTGRADDKAGIEIRYQIEQVNAKDASALAVSVLQMRRDGVIYTPNLADKQRYTSDRLNNLVGSLTKAYNKQMQDLDNAPIGGFASSIGKDVNGRTALVMQANFRQAWERLGYALPKLGFEITSETAGRGQRELKYSALEKEQWLRFASAQPSLENGSYSMQLSARGTLTSVVITDEKGQAITDDQAQIIYQALGNLLAK